MNPFTDPIYDASLMLRCGPVHFANEVPAIVAGFLLTAVPNWTGRLPVTGTPLLALVSVWTAGRIAVLLSARIGAPVAAAIDLLFLACLAGVIAREIIAARNLGNLKVLALVGLLLIGNAVFHAEASLMNGGSGYGTRIGIGVAVLLITLIGGRIIPSFTRNWLARQSPGRLPIAFGPFDVASLAAGALAIACWVAYPHAWPTAGLAAVAGVLHALRLAQWAGYRTSGEPLVLVLHVGYAFVPIGFLLQTLAIVTPDLVVASAACMDGWCRRHDDACRHDTRKPGSHGSGARCLPINAVDLRRDRGRGGSPRAHRI